MAAVSLVSLAARSLRFNLRSHLGVLLGATVASAILVGALSVGDSVHQSLHNLAMTRLGGVHLALNGQTRFMRATLADDLASELKADVAPVIFLRGTAASSEGDARAGHVQVIGTDARFWKLAPKPGPAPAGSDAPDTVVLNERLAHRLGVRAGGEVVLRVDKPSLLSRDAPLSTVTDSAVPLRLTVTAVVPDERFGRFSLDSNQVPPLNAFVAMPFLQQKLGLEGRANGMLAGAAEGRKPAPEAATSALWKHWQFTDASLDLHELPGRKTAELKTDRVFLDPPIGDAAMSGSPGAQGVLTYFVNELRVGDRKTPYSTVSALQSGLLPTDMRDDETLINQWLADDLQAKPGDQIKLSYWTVGPMRKLILQSSTYRIRAILPMQGEAVDPALMPNIPGLSDKKDCRDWEPGVPIDLEKLRDKDQAYWNKYRGSPKAFLTLKAGQKIWNNRFGNLTAVRYPLEAQTPGAIEACIRQALSPASLGIFFTPVREQAFAASSPSLDFGQLFLGFSIFLIVAALLLTALLFAFGVEQRAEEAGILLAVGFTPKQVQRLFIVEGGLLALIAGALGAGLAVLYTRAVIGGLSTVWSGAVGGSSLVYHAEPVTLIRGAALSFLTALFAIWMVARRQARSPARELLSSGSDSHAGLLASKGEKPRRWLPGIPTALLMALAAVGMAVSTKGQDSAKAAETFFGVGAALLIGGIALCRAALARIEKSASGTKLTSRSLSLRSSARRRGRSLTAIGLLACGSFLVIAVGANRHDPTEGAEKRTSGTGGFALYGESALPVFLDLNTPEGREEYGLETAQLGGAKVVPMRLKEGDDASCLNLNRAQAPRVLGVAPEAFGSRGAFTFAKVLGDTGNHGRGYNPWLTLEQGQQGGAIPCVGDANTVTWSLGKSLGDVVPYVDDRGATHNLRIVGVLANSVLQGGLIVSEQNFTKLFPTQAGYQVFLVDAPGAGAAKTTELSRTLTKGLEDVGLDLSPASERLAAFNTVENTYLSIFALLGGLGLLLGSAGLGVVVLRNVLERRGELALMRAVGFTQAALRRMVLTEHALLLVLGLLVGVGAAVASVLPTLRSPGAEAPIGSLAVTLLAVFVSGFVWTWLAAVAALRGPLLKALRNE